MRELGGTLRNGTRLAPAFDDHPQHKFNYEHRRDENLQSNKPAKVCGHNWLLYCKDEGKQIYADHNDIIEPKPGRV
jgi:hypothetical protein